MNNIFLIFVIIGSLTLAGCSKQNTKHVTNHGRYTIHQDRAPTNGESYTPSIQQWDIKPEVKSKYGNKSPYEVFGKTYYVAKIASDFEQTGMASWYGKKFHGHTTSNMEIFDMYKMTAAHRTLPLPSYVEVTNLDNNKKIIVRVNDRGPFKSKRIIDLSWAAAKELGYEKKGLARVHLRLIQGPGEKNAIQQAKVKILQPKEYRSKQPTYGVKYLQIGAYSKKNKAVEIAKKLSQVVIMPVRVSNSGDSLFRVRVGPLAESDDVIEIIQQVNRLGYIKTKMVYE